VKGSEFTKDEYVRFEPEELKALEAPGTQASRIVAYRSRGQVRQGTWPRKNRSSPQLSNALRRGVSVDRLDFAEGDLLVAVVQDAVQIRDQQDGL